MTKYVGVCAKLDGDFYCSKVILLFSLITIEFGNLACQQA
jgi:hypothetical protein